VRYDPLVAVRRQMVNTVTTGSPETFGSHLLGYTASHISMDRNFLS